MRRQLVLTPIDGSPETLLLETDPANGIWPVEWFPDGDSLVYVDVQRGYRVLRLHDLSTRAVTPFTDWIEPSPSGRFGITYAVDSIEFDTKNHWQLHELATGQQLRAVTHRHGVHRLAWSPDERHFVDQCREVPVGHDRRGLCVYDRATLMPTTRLAEPTAETSLDFARWIA